MIFSGAEAALVNKSGNILLGTKYHAVFIC